MITHEQVNLMMSFFGENLIPLFIGLLVIRLTKMTLKSFQSVYLGLAALNLLLQYLIFGSINTISIIAIAAGIGLVLLATGFFGKRDSSAHYETLLVAVGLFPWQYNWIMNVVYVLSALVYCLILKIVARRMAFNAANRDVAPLENVKATLSEENYTKLRMKINPVMTTPTGLASLTALTVFILML